MYLPVIIAPKNDETTASWIRRLTLANGFDNTEEFAQQFICDSDIASGSRFKNLKGTEDFISLYRALNLQDISMQDLYMETSCYGGVAPFLSDARQTHYLNTAFRLGMSNDSIVNASNSLTSELRFCPICKEEDKAAGSWYYHRAHQMPSVKVCYKHGCVLRRFTGKTGTELSKNLSNVVCTNKGYLGEQEFAVFAKKLLDAAPDVSAEDTKAAVLREVKRQGFYAPASDYAKLNTALKNAGVYISNLSRLLLQMYDMNYVAIDDLMRLCWFLFGTADKFISACKQVQKPTVPLQLPEGYTACSPYHRNIMEFEHSCGTRFCINPVGFMNGWQCPVCDGAMSLQQQYEKVVRWTGHGDYTVEGKFKGMEQPIILCHKCGRTINRPARDFVYDGARCICESTRTFEEMQDKIQSYGDFELLKYDPKTERAQIRHSSCGRNFEIGYAKFLKVPVCKVCQPAIRNSEIFKREIKELVGDEYELVGEYSDKDTKVVLRHMLETLYRNTHGIIDQLVGLCMYLNLDYISSKSRPTIDADYINKVAKRHYRGIQKLMDELDDPLNEKKRQKIIEEADRKLDNLLQEHKQTAFAEKIMESAEADEKKIPLKKNIIHNIEMVVADYTSDRIAAAVDRVLISTDETDEKVLTRVVMKLLTDSKKETPTKKQKSKKKPLQTSDMVKFIIE